MSTQRCACPSCHKPFSVPTSLNGKAARCPRCRTRLVVRAMGGRTALEVAGIDGGAPTAVLPPEAFTAPATAREAPATPAPSVARRNLRALGCGAAIVAVPLLLCCAGLVGSFASRKLLDGQDAARPQEPQVSREAVVPAGGPARQEAPARDATVIDLATIIKDYDSPNRLATDAKYVGKWYEFTTADAEVFIDSRPPHLGFAIGTAAYTEYRVNCTLTPAGIEKAKTLNLQPRPGTSSHPVLRLRGRFQEWRSLSWPYSNINLEPGGLVFVDCDLLDAGR